MLCSVVTAACNRSACTRMFLDSLQRSAEPPFETIVVDSRDVHERYHPNVAGARLARILRDIVAR